MSRFIQIHTLTSYPAALLNRDDVGSAKRMLFGGAVRTRISSQCLKRHWRTHKGKHDLDSVDAPASVRSRNTFEKLVRQQLVAEGLDDERVRLATEIVMAEVLGESPKAKKSKKAAAEEGTSEETLQTKQLTVLGAPEIDYLRDLARSIATLDADLKGLPNAAKALLTKEVRKNLVELKNGAGLGAALFGRMVTSDRLARVDAAIHVAHALTVHAQESESDYFTAVDDLALGEDDDELGSGHLGQTELTSGLYYSYVVVDVPLLISNLTGKRTNDLDGADATLAASVVRSLIYLISTVSPGAKLGSTAPYARAHCVFVEAGDEQPRTLANAFLKPVRPNGDTLSSTYDALGRFYGAERAMYGTEGERALAAMGDTAPELAAALGADLGNLEQVADFAANAVSGIATGSA